MKKCGSNCTSCPYIEEGNKVKINSTEWKIKNKFDCNFYNVIYAILCKKEKCKQVYIGETRRLLNFRVADHRGYVSRQETDKATGAHFTMPGHSLADLRVTIIDVMNTEKNVNTISSGSLTLIIMALTDRSNDRGWGGLCV